MRFDIFNITIIAKMVITGKINFSKVSYYIMYSSIIIYGHTKIIYNIAEMKK